MSNLLGPAWSLDGSTWHTFLGAYKYGGKPTNIEEVNTHLISDSGVDFVYNKYLRWTHEITFRFPDTFYSTIDSSFDPDYGFLDFYATVGGESGFGGATGGINTVGGEFFFSMGGYAVSYADAITVRLAEACFNPTELQTAISGNMVFYDEDFDSPGYYAVGGPLWEYVLKLKQSVDDTGSIPPVPYNSTV